MPGLAGNWRDTAEGTTHVIIWDGQDYQVISSINDARGVYDIVFQEWDGNTLIFNYYVPASGVTVTIEATMVIGNTLYVNWWSTNGNSGTDTFTRLP